MTNNADPLLPARLVDRRTVFGAIGAAGLSALLLGCADDDESTGPGDEPTGDDAERVIIVGAGPAGLTAALRLRRRGVVATVLEAASTHGGRTKHDLEFADFPIPLGAEWLHTDRGVFDEIVDDESVDIDIETVPYADDDLLAYFADGVTELLPLVGFEGDEKFVDSGWLDFFDRYVVPDVADQIEYDTAVTAIDSNGDTITVVDANGVERIAERVIVTVPLAVLQRDEIEFRPELPAERRTTIDDANVWTGLKAFIEFDEAFYPAATATVDSETEAGQRVYYDAAYGQDTDLHVLGLFSVGAQAERYQALDTSGELLDTMLAELDAVFDGAATPAYRRHIVQNWAEEPFIGQAYLADVAGVSTSRRLAEPIDDRIFFAGDAYTSFDDWGSVHTAARSAIEAVDRLLAA